MCSVRNVRLSTDHCSSMFQHATHNSRAGYCLALGERSLRALFALVRVLLCNKLLRARSYGLIVLQIVASSMLVSQ